MSEEKWVHQLHILIPIELYAELKQVFPDKGMITGVVRRFLTKCVSEIRKADLNESGVSRSPVDIATESIIEEDLKRR